MSDRRAREILEAALELPADKRDSYAREACGEDTALLAEVVRLFRLFQAQVATTVDPPQRVPPAHDTATLVTAPELFVCSHCGFRTADATLRFCPADKLPLVEDPRAKVGTLLDGLYAIKALLGQGGMGAVYRARHIMLDDEVAIKILPRNVSDDPVRLRRFQIEGAAARRFRHPGAVAVHDLRTAVDGTVYLVQELVTGETLRATLVDHGPYRAEDALPIIEQIASVLDAAHAAGVVHRDLKPDNIMLVGRTEPVVKVLDLGIAKLFGTASTPEGQLTQTGSFLGTPVYMSPEQWGEIARDGVKEIDGRTDVYSLGVMSYELLVGRPPFVGQSIASIAHSHVAEVPVFPASIATSVAAVVGKALAKDRNDRFATAGEFATALRDAISPGSIQHAGGATVDLASEANTLPDAAQFTIDRGSPRTNLPQETTSLVGREADVASIVHELGKSRLLTLTGPGGIGKTRLGIRAASSMLPDFPDGVWLVELAAISDPSHALPALASVLGIKQESDRALVATVADTLGSSRVLFVVDNCEHVLDTIAAAVDSLIRACPNVKFLATSRELLRCSGEAVFRVPSLSLPDESSASAMDSGAVRLFLDRATASRPGFTPDASDLAGIARLVSMLDGIPLAIELAAARVRMLSIEQLLTRMDDCFRVLSDGRRAAVPRQQTLRAAIDWSYSLLDERESAVLRRLSVFAGGCTLEAAEAVCAGDDVVDAYDVLDLLAELADKSLLTIDYDDETPRYGLLQTIRQYLAEKLHESGESERIKTSHAQWFLAYAERARAACWTEHEAEWFSNLLSEHENLRTALRAVDGADLARFARALGRFWDLRGFWTEGRGWLEKALQNAPPELHAELTLWLGAMLKQMGETLAARELLEKSLARRDPDREVVAQALTRLAGACENLGDIALAREYLLEAYAIGQEIGNTYCWLGAVSLLGSLLLRQGEYDDAITWLERGVAANRSIGNRWGVNVCLGNLGAVLLHIDDQERAEAVLTESLNVARECGDRLNITTVLYNLGFLALRRGDLPLAERKLTECLEYSQRLGFKQSTGSALVTLGRVASEQGRFSEAISRYEAVVEMIRDLSLPGLYLDVMESVAVTSLHMNRQEDALVAFGAASKMREEIQQTMSPAEHADLDTYVQAARDAVGAEAAEAALARGREMGAQEALNTMLPVLARVGRETR